LAVYVGIFCVFVFFFFGCPPGKSLSALVQFSHVHYAKIGLSSGLWLSFPTFPGERNEVKCCGSSVACYLFNHMIALPIARHSTRSPICSQLQAR